MLEPLLHALGICYDAHSHLDLADLWTSGLLQAGVVSVISSSFVTYWTALKARVFGSRA